MTPTQRAQVFELSVFTIFLIVTLIWWFWSIPAYTSSNVDGGVDGGPCPTNVAPVTNSIGVCYED